MSLKTFIRNLFGAKRREARKEDQAEAAIDILGPNGTMISYSKSTYREENPKNLAIFNANICTKSSGKVWFGDIDVTLSKERLQILATVYGEPVYVLHEMDGRFQNEEKPLLSNAMALVFEDRVVLRTGLEKHYTV